MAPGTAATGLPSALAALAVDRLPERARARTTTTAHESSAMTVLRDKNRGREIVVVGQNGETTAPRVAARPNRSA